MNKEEFIKYIIDILIYPDEFKINNGYQSFYKNNLCYFTYSIKFDRLCYSGEFEEECGFNCQEIENILKYTLSKYFKMDKTIIY